jgi:type I restriction enzyme S subunit
MKRYKSYKESGVSWIGQIPEHWESIRLGVLGVFSSSGIDKKLDENEPSVRMVNYTDIIKGRVHNSVIDNKIDFMVVTTPQSKIDEHKLKKGDLVFLPSSETSEDLGVSSLIDFDEIDIVYSYHIIRFKFTREVNHYFKKYLGNHYGVYTQFSSEGKGTTRQIIGRNVFRNVVVVLPPIDEQGQIVRFLDEKTDILQKLIHIKEKKISLLKEQKISLISQTVTKGLEHGVKMKFSNFDWIGEIPEHWELKRICYVFKPVSIKNNLNEINLSVYRDYGVIPTDSRDDNHNVISEDISNYKLVQVGDFVMNKMKCWMGSLGLSDYRGIVSPSYTVMRPITNENRKYLHYLLRSQLYIPQYRRLSYGVRVGQWDMRFEDFRELPCIIPPLNEQDKIVEFLNTKTMEIDNMVSVEQKKIELLKEYRQSLISEVVTGKIKVTTD